MTEVLRGWILGIVGAAVVTAVVLVVSPDTRAKKVVAVVCGFMMIIALLRPVEGFDYGGFKLNFARLQQQAQDFTEPLNAVNENLTSAIIEERYAAYISDKGATLGISDLAVTVEAELYVDGFWYPNRVFVTTEADKSLRDKLAYEIEAGLGIASEELIWGDTND